MSCPRLCGKVFVLAILITGVGKAMIEIYTERLAGNDVLLATPAGKRQQPLPCVVFYHGFTSSKLVYSYFAVALAQRGLRVIMPDAPEHGARFDGDEHTRLQRFWQILHASLAEFPALYAAIEERGLVEEGRLGVGGASMGDMTALGLMTQHTQIRSVACLMGSGYYLSLARRLFPPVSFTQADDEQRFADIIAPLKQYDVSQQLVKLADRPLLLWHGEDDDVVPAFETLRLQQALQAQGLDGQLTCLWEKGVKHRITHRALEETGRFFEASL